MPSIRDRIAREILERQLRVPPPVPLKVGILGVGAAGLYAAMILEGFKEYGYTYEILEAEPDNDHVGGRLWTYKFSDSPNDYYDRGAMRFPKIDFMKPVFDLFDNLGITDDGLLIPYILSNDEHNILYYNGIRMTAQEVKDSALVDPFNIGLASHADDYVKAALGPFIDALATDFESGWQKLMEYDQYSTRAYMNLVLKTAYTASGIELNYTDQVITTLETLQTGTNLYDCALSESVMDALDFDNPSDPSWYCIQGGSEEIARRMAARLQPGTILRGKRVTAIAPLIESTDTPTSINVTVAGGESYTYDHVISTMPLSCLGLVDTTQCGLSWPIQMAIRALHYDASVKVAIKFSYRWWEQSPFLQSGGSSSSDRPTRVVVYPSYGIGGDDGTMIVSYTWSQDALRFGALAHGNGSDAERALVDVILKDLADIHGNDLTAEQLRSWMKGPISIFTRADDPIIAGAFALFGPSQFNTLYTELTKPPAGLLHFAGEATSVHHAWLIGALNSAYRCVEEIFLAEDRQDLVDILEETWGKRDEFRSSLVKEQVERGRAQFLRQ
ncbi:hypothetical protein POSPLADRAFT_1048165 [Postia placenta MAD-698-R-SB12]|uniref:Amine oxidase domain-containing protein n=1 Tax=Postia placenta MAD-698-R-SB12 TaxID=670580 RepID=A0A1X6MTH4_9APHY|nr:hypothetical protein POSPLADRAFT_1048165 [Postia placenta MAD-698-R-SB12]OSX59667.1 hypothetical protein POSPLADRAFT_1048165 [Postia placenta MAD-698-R-SB12]